MTTLRAANLALAFLLELCALAALGYWGWRVGQSWPMRLLLGLGAPVLAAVVWGAFVAPKAAVTVPGPVRFALGVVVFGVAALALWAAAQPTLALVFIVVAVINRVLILVWRQ